MAGLAASTTDIPAALSGAFVVPNNGTYTLTVSVADDDGGSDIAETTFITKNVAPTIVDLNPSSATGVIGAKLTFDARDVSDPGVNDTLTYLWAVTTNNGQTVPPSEDVEFNFTPLYSGVYSVSLTVTDSDGAATTQTQTFNVNPIAVATMTPASPVQAFSLVTLDGSTSSTLAPQGPLFGENQQVRREYQWATSAGLFVPSYSATVLSGAPLLYYPLNETSGTQAVDASGNARHGTYTGAVRFGDASATPKLGTAVGFLNGSPDTSVAVPALGTQTQLTFETWIKPASYDTLDTIYNSNSFPAGAVHLQLASSGAVRFSQPGQANRDFGSSANFPLNQWTYLVVTHNASTGSVSVYANGLLVGTQAGNAVTPNLPAANIGAWDGTTREFNGSIDDFAIYGRVLSDSEIKQHYAARLIDTPTINVVPTTTGTHSATLTVTDVFTTDGVAGETRLSNSQTINFNVTAAPTLDISRLPAAPVEGDVITLNPNNLSALPQLSGTSVGSRTYQWSVTSTNGQSITNGTAESFAFVPSDEGTYTATLTVTDRFGAQTVVNSKVSTIAVVNAAPAFIIDGDATLILGSPNDILIRFTDGGASDTFTYTLNWGDGTVNDTGSATSVANGIGRVGMISGTHSYATEGNKTATITVNDNDGGSSVSTFTIFDRTVPTADIVDVTADPRNTNAGTVTINFSETVTGVGISDFVLTRGGLAVDISGLTVTQVTTSQYTLNLSSVTATAGVYELTLLAAGTSIQDSAGNLVTKSVSDLWTMDLTAPTVTLTNFGAAPLSAATGTATFTFSEPVTGFDLADLSLTRNGSNVSLAGLTLTQGSSIEFSLNLSTVAATFGNYVLTVSGSGGIQDLATNALASGNSSWSIEQVAPTATITIAGNDRRRTDIGNVAIAFSENVTGFNLADLTLTRNGSAVSLTGLSLVQLSPSEYTIDLSSVTAAEGGYVLTLTAAGSGIQDRVTNAMAVNSTTSWTVDTTAPTANVVDVTPDPRTTEVGVVTITFNEPVIGLTIGDVMLTRDGSVLDLTGTPITQISSTQYEIDLTDFTRFDGTVFNELGVGAPFSAIVPGQYMLSVSAASGTVIDAAGNPFAADVNDSWVIDLSGPVASFAGLPTSPINTTVGLVTVTFDEPVTGVGLSDFTLTRNGSAVSLTSVPFVAVNSTTYTLNLATVTTLAGTYQFKLAGTGSGIIDSVGNAIAGEAIGQFEIDKTAPTAVLDSVTPTSRSSAVGVLAVTFDDPVSGVDLSDFSLTRGGVAVDMSNVTITQISEARYEVDLSSVTDFSGVYVFSLNAGTAQIEDVAGNLFATTLTTTWTTDTTAPTATLSGVPATPPRNSPVGLVTVTFNETVSGVDTADFTLTRSGTVIDLSALTVTPVSGTVYTLNLASVTAEAGDYQLTLRANGSGITNNAGTTILEDKVATWSTDLTAPTASISSETPDATNVSLGIATIEFSEDVTGLNLADFTLTRDGSSVNLTGATLTPESASRYLLDLSNLTATAGQYVLSLTAGTSGIVDVAGNALAANLSLSRTVDVSAPIAGIVAVTPRASAHNWVI